MPVFFRDKLRILYIHVPKTGGSSLEQFFRRNEFRMAYFGGARHMGPVLRCSPQHMHAEILRTVFNVEKFDYVFMTVRNPFARLFSEYRMRNNSRKPNRREPDAWIAATLNRYGKNQYILDNHIRPQVEYRVADCDVYRIEDGYDAKWVKTLSEKLSLKFACEEVGHFQRGADEATEPMSGDNAARVRDLYREDFAAFGYDSSSAADNRLAQGINQTRGSDSVPLVAEKSFV